jgi:hypothetical protein
MIGELDQERATLAHADRDIASGQDRIERQRALLMSGRLKGPDIEEAERLLGALQSTLAEWERHRALIVERIAYLTARNSGGA